MSSENRKKRRLWPVMSAIIVAVALAVGWFTVGRGVFGGRSLATMTRDQAFTRAEEHIRKAVAVLSAKPRLELQGDLDIPCDDVASAKGRNGVERKYWLRDLAASSNSSVFDELRKYWSANGYQMVRDDGQTFDGLVAAYTADEFSVGLQQNVQGDLLIWSSSPCVVKK